MRNVPVLLTSLFNHLLRPVGIIIAAILFFLATFYFDTRTRFLPYTYSITLVVAAIFFVASRRLVFSLYCAGTIVLLLAVVSYVKFEMKGLALHSYDFFFTGTDWKIIEFLAVNYTGIVLAAAIGLLLAVAFLAQIYRMEQPFRVRLLARAPAVFLFAGVAYAAHPVHNPREAEYLPYIAGYNASALPISLWHLPDLLKDMSFVEKVDYVAIDKPLTDEVTCGEGGKQPDLFLVLSESQGSPLTYPKISVPEAIVDSYRSGDKTIKPLYVETVGAGTWMTNFSVLTGMSTADFGWQAAYVTQLMENRVKGALPDVLARCGYRTVAVMPLNYHSLNEGPFLKSIGFQEVYDAEAIGHDPMTVRDKTYFDFVEKLIAEHRREDGRPLFVQVQTMFAHSPYDSVLLPEVKVPAHPFSDVPDINEFMRRVAAARIDIEAFRDNREIAPGPNGSVVAEFGDHQSIATREMALAGRDKQTVLSDFRSPIYETYFIVHGYGATVDYSRLHQGEDAAFLAARLLDAVTGLPKSPMFEDLLKVSDACGGRFHTCEERKHVDANLKKRIAGGLLAMN